MPTNFDIFATEVNTFYLLICSVLVFAMHLGFAMLEAGTIKAKNVRNVLFKNIIAVCVGGLCFWLIGFGVAYGGSDDNDFIGSAKDDGKYSFAFRVDDVASSNLTAIASAAASAAAGYSWVSWFFQYCFAAAAATIVSGALAGRVNLIGFIIYTCVLTGFVYPVVVHWVWDGHGWLSAFNGEDTDFEGGMIDFAGSGVVHLTGGVSALIGASILGPRKGRFEGNDDFSAHSAPLQVLGMFILWVGWYGFNCGSTLGIINTGDSAGVYARDAARVAVTTTLSACTAAVTATATAKFNDGVWDVGCMCNGILAGLVSITAGCSVTEPWAAILIGAIGGVICVLASKMLVALRIDDPLDAFPVHGACGTWGVIAVGLFCSEDYTYNMDKHAGLFTSGDGALLGIQLVGILSIASWVGGLMAILFFALKTVGLLRADPHDEDAGMDISEHEGPAYVIAVPAGGPPPSFEKPKAAAITPTTGGG